MDGSPLRRWTKRLSACRAVRVAGSCLQVLRRVDGLRGEGLGIPSPHLRCHTAGNLDIASTAFRCCSLFSVSRRLRGARYLDSSGDAFRNMFSIRFFPGLAEDKFRATVGGHWHSQCFNVKVDSLPPRAPLCLAGTFLCLSCLRSTGTFGSVGR